MRKLFFPKRHIFTFIILAIVLVLMFMSTRRVFYSRSFTGIFCLYSPKLYR